MKEPRVVLAHAVPSVLVERLVLEDSRAHLELLASWVHEERLDSLDFKESPVFPERPDAWDPLAAVGSMDLPEELARLALKDPVESLVSRVPEVQEDHQAVEATLGLRVLLEHLEHLVFLDPVDSLVAMVPMERTVLLVEMELPESRVLLDPLDALELGESQEPVAQEAETDTKDMLVSVVSWALVVTSAQEDLPDPLDPVEPVVRSERGVW